MWFTSYLITVTNRSQNENREKRERHIEWKEKEKLDETGIDPVTYPLRRDHSTIWATHPLALHRIYRYIKDRTHAPIRCCTERTVTLILILVIGYPQRIPSHSCSSSSVQKIVMSSVLFSILIWVGFVLSVTSICHVLYWRPVWNGRVFIRCTKRLKPQIWVALSYDECYFM